MLVLAWVVGLLPTLALAGSVKYDKYRSIAQRNGGLVSLDSAGYDDLIASPRDYSVSIVLTALGDQINCGPCRCFLACSWVPRREQFANLRLDRILQPEYAQLAKQWHHEKKAEDEDHIFAYLDFQHGAEIFQRVSPFLAPPPPPHGLETPILLLLRACMEADLLHHTPSTAWIADRADLPALLADRGSEGDQKNQRRCHRLYPHVSLVTLRYFVITRVTIELTA